jgi:hypothetical protein
MESCFVSRFVQENVDGIVDLIREKQKLEAEKQKLAADLEAEKKKLVADHFECRYAKGTSTSTDIDITTTDPYAITREGVFGKKAGEQQIAHLQLILAGRIFHKLWLNVACAVLGIDRSVALDVKKKAARGYRLSTT